MSIKLLKTLMVVEECESFSAAAKQVFLTQAAVGQQMQKLEELLGATLFDRDSKTPKLNQLGKALVPKAREVVASYENILDGLTGDPRFIGELSIGAVPSVIRGLIPKTIKRLVESYPDLKVRLIPDLSPMLIEQVERGAVDAAILSKPPRVPISLNWRSFVNEKFVLLASSEITENDPIQILQTAPYIRQTRLSDVGILAEDWLVKNRIKVKESVEVGSLDNLISMVAENLGVSVVPDLCVSDPIFQRLRKIKFDGVDVYRTLGILTRSDCSKLLLVDKLHEKIISTVEVG